MTRKQLAEAIYSMEVEAGNIRYSEMNVWVNGILNGCGAAKAMKKGELQDWYERMVSEA